MSKIVARERFIEGQKKVDEPNTEEDLEAAEQDFIAAYDEDNDFYRALGWRGYTLVRMFEDGFRDADVLEDAMQQIRNGHAVDDENAAMDMIAAGRLVLALSAIGLVGMIAGWRIFWNVL